MSIRRREAAGPAYRGESAVLRVLSVAALMAGSFQTAAAPIQLEPNGPWRVDYADELCILNRSFGQSGGTHTLALTLEPLQSRAWLRLRSPDRVRRRDDEKVTVEVDGVPLKDPVHMNIFPTDSRESVREFLFDDFRTQVGTMDRTIRFRTRRHGDLLVNAIEFPKAMEAMEACVDDLHRSLGIDPALLRSVKTSPEAWSGEVIDLPEFSERFEYRILYWVNRDGRVDECRVLGSTGDAKFGEQACEQLKTKGRFKAALNTDGERIRAPVYENNTILTTLTLERQY